MSIKVYSRRQLMIDTAAIKPYISNGLVFHLDGADATTTSWVDRVNNVTFDMYNVTCDGKGVYFNGSNSYGHSSTTVVYDYRTSTIEVVIRRTQASGFVFQAINSNAIVYISGAGNINFSFGAKRPNVTANMQLNKTVTHSINFDRNYLNGTQYAFTTADSWGRQGTGTDIGRRGNGTYYFKGYMYQIRIYNRKLSDAEILFNQEQDRKKYGIQF